MKWQRAQGEDRGKGQGPGAILGGKEIRGCRRRACPGWCRSRRRRPGPREPERTARWFLFVKGQPPPHVQRSRRICERAERVHGRENRQRPSRGRRCGTDTRYHGNTGQRKKGSKGFTRDGPDCQCWSTRSYATAYTVPSGCIAWTGLPQPPCYVLG